MPGPGGRKDEISQDLYPYARQGPVSYMEPGQTFFGSMRTEGGWWVATPAHLDLLVAAGLPRTAPAVGPETPWTIVSLVALVAALAAIGALAFGVARRRPQPA